MSQHCILQILRILMRVFHPSVPSQEMVFLQSTKTSQLKFLQITSDMTSSHPLYLLKYLICGAMLCAWTAITKYEATWHSKQHALFHWLETFGQKFLFV